MTPDCGQPSVRTCMGIVDEAGRLEREGHPVIHLEKGEVDLDTPAAVKDAAIAALHANQTRYSHSSGLPELREAIAAYYGTHYGVPVDPARVIVYPGSSAAMLELFLLLLDPGDEVVLPDPGYPAYPAFVTAARGVPVRAGSAAHGFHHTAELVRERLSARTRAVLINFPSNPIGSTAGRDELAAFAELGPLVVADEVYHGLESSGVRSPSILEVTDNCVVVGSFSKGYAMTGWRLGYLVLPQALAARLASLHSDLFVGTTTFTQWAAVEALTRAEDVQRQLRTELDRRRAVLLAQLPRIGLEPAHSPDGGFYVFTRQPPGTGSAVEFAAELLEKTLVAVTPGTVFGPSGAGHIRLSLSSTPDQIVDAADRIAAYLAESRPVVAAGAGARR